MLRWVLVLVLVMASAIARAQTPPPVIADQAQAREVELDRTYHQQMNEQHRLQAQFADQTAAIDRMKQRRRSWANDRELNTAQADANETAQQLATIAQTIKATADRLATARRALIDAIDAELAANPSAERRQALVAIRTRVAPQVASAPHKIVVPNSDIDPSADPEDLDRQAAALKQTDDELARQETSLAKQVDDLNHIAQVTKEHNRAQDVAYRDDDQSHRTTTSSSHGSPNIPSPTSANNGGGAGNGQVGLGSSPSNNNTTAGAPPSGSDRGELSDATVVLADVVDASTIQQLRRAQTSNDPAQRAVAAKQAEAAVAARRDQLRKKREAIEARARQLRGGQ
jgi:hypothetical protein